MISHDQRTTAISLILYPGYVTLLQTLVYKTHRAIGERTTVPLPIPLLQARHILFTLLFHAIVRELHGCRRRLKVTTAIPVVHYHEKDDMEATFS
jgi:hypothetical protein